MALTVLSGIPDTLILGDAASFTVSDPDFPVATWTSATIYFKNGSPVSFSGTVSGSAFLFTLTNAQTATLTAGRTLVCVSYSDGTNRQTSAWTEINVLANPAATDAVSHAANMVATLERVVLALAADGKASVTLDGVSYVKRDLSTVRADLVYWKAQVIKEQQSADAARGIRPARIITQFVCP